MFAVRVVAHGDPFGDTDSPHTARATAVCRYVEIPNEPMSPVEVLSGADHGEYNAWSKKSHMDGIDVGLAQVYTLFGLKPRRG